MTGIKRTIDHDNYFGGRVCQYDFEAETYMADIAERIANDQKFDERCRMNACFRNRQKNPNQKGNR